MYRDDDIRRMEERFVKHHNQLAAQVNRIGSQQAQIMTRENISAVKEVTADVYSKANAYTNLIIAAGYVGFFTVWSAIKNDISSGIVLSSGSLMLLSLFIFIAFEIYKMVSISVTMHKVVTRVQNPSFGSLSEVQHIQREHSLSAARVWVFCLVPTILAGVIAAIILLAGLITHTIQPYV